MKTLAPAGLLACLLSAALFRSQDPNPLINTAWQGPLLLRIDMERVIVYHFKTDTLKMYMAEDRYLFETMRYTVNGNTMTLQKIDGNSSCDTQTIGQYQFTVTNDELTIKPVSDDCEIRLQAHAGKPMKKVVIPTK